MATTFLYFAHEQLTDAELRSARLDGDLVEIGAAFMPTDAVETTELRAASLRPEIPDTVAVTLQSAAWVHGATAVAPARHTVQRRSRVRPHHVLDLRLDYRDQLIGPQDLVGIGGLWVTSPARTLADLVRARYGGADLAELIESVLAWQPAIAVDAVRLLERSGAVHYKRPALAFLRARTMSTEQTQDDVTRYTS